MGLLFTRGIDLPTLASAVAEFFEKLLISFGFDDAGVVFLDIG